MRTIRLSLFLAACVMAGAATAAPEKKDGKGGGQGATNLEGTWSLVRMEEDGKAHKVDRKDADYFDVVFAGRTITVRLNDANEVGTFTVDATKKPKTIDVVPSMGKDKGKTLLGIYEVDGDSLKLCVADDASVKERPKEFASKGTSVRVFHLKRVKS